jgi:hypothetical protein
MAMSSATTLGENNVGLVPFYMGELGMQFAIFVSKFKISTSNWVGT